MLSWACYYWTISIRPSLCCSQCNFWVASWLSSGVGSSFFGLEPASFWPPTIRGTVSSPCLSLQSLHLTVFSGVKRECWHLWCFVSHPAFFCIQRSSRDPNPSSTLKQCWGRGEEALQVFRGLHCSAEGLYPGNLLPLPETRTHSWDFGKLRRSYYKEWATWGQWGKWCRGEPCYFEQVISALASSWHWTRLQ